MKRLAMLAMVMTAAACGKSKGGGGAAAATADPGPANAAIPAAWKGKLEFAVQTLGDDDKHSADQVTTPAPKGWKKGFMPGEVDPPDGNSDFGFGTNLRVGGTCGGDCKAKSAAEWAAAADDSFFKNILAHTPAPKVAKDEKKDGRRTLIATDQNTDGNMNLTYVVTAWWKDGGERFYFCEASLADEAKDLAPAFEKACMAAVEQAQ